MEQNNHCTKQLHCLSFSWHGIVFFKISGMMVCFGFRRKTFITHRCLYLLLSSVVQSETILSDRAQGDGREQNQNS